jgi:hypothetical protein
MMHGLKMMAANSKQVLNDAVDREETLSLGG